MAKPHRLGTALACCFWVLAPEAAAHTALCKGQCLGAFGVARPLHLSFELGTTGMHALAEETCPYSLSYDSANSGGIDLRLLDANDTEIDNAFATWPTPRIPVKVAAAEPMITLACVALW